MDGPPVSIDSLAGDLRALGVRTGTTTIVHSSLSSLGWVIGDAPAVIAGLIKALGPDGTLAMPTHSGGLSDPAGWVAPPIPVEWHERVRAEMPAYEPAITPTRIVGAIPESFRTHPGVRRSAHPRQSFAARGPQAMFITDGHPYDCAMGERSPLARLYDLDADVLLLGVGHDRNTSLHLAEHRATYPAKRMTKFASPVTIAGARRWLEVDDLEFDESDFARLGDDFERDTGATIIGKVGAATARLMRQRALVDYAVGWMGRFRR